MTEQQWLNSDDPFQMVNYLRVRGKVSNRKFSLYACACCWANSRVLGQDAEQCLEQPSGPARDPAGWAMAWAGDQKSPPPAVRADILRDVVGNPFRPWVREDAFTRGNPAAAPSVNVVRTTWLTPAALCLAQFAYNRRGEDGTLDPLTLAALSDALEEAGCQGKLLAHLRSGGPHYRGCWALDLVLGRE